MRIVNLKKRLLERSDDAVFYERMTLLLEAEKKYRQCGNGEKYARCFAYVLENMTVRIYPDELVVGSAEEKLMDARQTAVFEENCRLHNTRATELFSFDALGILPITDDDMRFAPEWLCSYGHLIPDWEKLLAVGYGGLKAEAQARQRDDMLTTDQEDFLQNCIIACDGMITLATRYSDEAKRLAEACGSADEKARLLRIESVLRCAPECGAKTFHEAVQLVWMTMLVLHTVCGARDYAYGQMDQYLWPYYQADIERGTLKRGDALELLQCLFIKSNEIIGYSWEAYRPKRILSVNSLQYVLLSGADINGNDTTNDLSWLILNAMDELQIKQPTLNVRYHKNIDTAFFERACEISAKGLGYPSFFNDAVVLQALDAAGVDKSLAVNYGYYGCNNSFLPGREDELREAWHCVPKYLEYALCHGRCLLSGKVQGCITPSANKLTSMDDIYEALRQQIADGIRKSMRHVMRSDAYWNEIKPFSFESVIMSDCIRKASSMNDKGSLQRHMNSHLVGLATVANSLYAIEQLVYVQQRFTLPEMVELLRGNWTDDEFTRHEVKERFAKYGNDDDAVDKHAARVAKMFVDEVMKASPIPNGRKLYPSVYSLWHHREYGKLCAASADGRLAGEELSESQSPVYGTEQNGPTAMFNSIAKLPLYLTPSGGINVKFQPRLFDGADGYKNLAALLAGYFGQGGMHAQINVIDRETLIDAQKHPENHRNLMVRVVGYSAYFVTLSPEQQQEIIDRTAL